jgi:hypothetical protein
MPGNKSRVHRRHVPLLGRQREQEDEDKGQKQYLPTFSLLKSNKINK